MSVASCQLKQIVKSQILEELVKANSSMGLIYSVPYDCLAKVRSHLVEDFLVMVCTMWGSAFLTLRHNSYRVAHSE